MQCRPANPESSHLTQSPANQRLFLQALTLWKGMLLASSNLTSTGDSVVLTGCKVRSKCAVCSFCTDVVNHRCQSVVLSVDSCCVKLGAPSSIIGGVRSVSQPLHGCQPVLVPGVSNPRSSESTRYCVLPFCSTSMYIVRLACTHTSFFFTQGDAHNDCIRETCVYKSVR